jgi:hypothetical protein
LVGGEGGDADQVVDGGGDLEQARLRSRPIEPQDVASGNFIVYTVDGERLRLDTTKAASILTTPANNNPLDLDARPRQCLATVAVPIPPDAEDFALAVANAVEDWGWRHRRPQRSVITTRPADGEMPSRRAGRERGSAHGHEVSGGDVFSVGALVGVGEVDPVFVLEALGEHVEAEVDRHIATPGQATSYLVGRLEIERLRRNAERHLGPRFSVADFHDVLLGSGSVPLHDLARRVDVWLGTPDGSH